MRSQSDTSLQAHGRATSAYLLAAGQCEDALIVLLSYTAFEEQSYTAFEEQTVGAGSLLSSVSKTMPRWHH